MGARRLWVTIGVLVLVGLIGLIFAGYWFNWDWTGFNEHIGPRVPQYQPTKTLWDWLQLLLIPLVLAVAALLFNRATTRTEQTIALDKQREDLLQAYLDRMSELLLEKKLATSPSEEESNVARVRTISLLFQLDARRIGYVFAFLREAGLMSAYSDSRIVSLSQGNLNKIDLSQANLSEANLSEANLSEANLSETNLRQANLSEANLFGANLGKANLSEANLSEANLGKANLGKANLFGADLHIANLIGANLSKANLRQANLSEADLSEADLSQANLIRTIVTEAQLKKAKSLDLATMPNGSKHR